ncbi:MAG TPA: branched-chain amino acid ABC transporter permease [Candidatus Limnocylindrales bacterium]|nr:branched-chain amino acid ABC transporter permease [Candidatus Limnocylindrales bacterium]
MTTGNGLAVKLKNFLLTREVMVGLAVLTFMIYFYIGRGLPMVLTILIDFAVFAIITMSLNLEVGYTGISQFGRVIAVIAGAFAVGAIPGRFMAGFMGLPAGLSYGDDAVNFQVVPQITALLENSWLLSIVFFIFCILIAALSGAGVGWLVSRPAIRLKEAYLGISLLAFGDFFMWVGHNWMPLVGGSTGVFVPDPFRVFGAARFEVVVITIFVFSILVYVYLNKLTRSPFGRMLKMVRDNDVSAAAAGKDIVKIRTQSLVIGAAIAAMAGGLYVIYTGTVTAMGFGRLTWTFWPWAFMMLGGIGSTIGVLLGVFVLTILRTLITIYRFRIFGFLMAFGIDPVWLEFTLMGAVIVGVILFLPYGLVPEKVEPILRSSSIKRLLGS